MISKGQATLEALVIFGLLVIGAIIFGAYYFQATTPRNTEDLDLGTDRIFKDKINKNQDFMDSNTPLPCNNNGVCDSGENNSNCPDDCYCGNGVCDSGEYCYTCEVDCGPCTPIIGTFSDFNLILDPVVPSVINNNFNIIADINSNNSYADIILVGVTKYDELLSTWDPTYNCEFNGNYNSTFTDIGQLLPSGTDLLSNTFTFSCNSPGNYDFEFTVSSPDGSSTLVRTITESGYINGKEIRISGCDNPIGTALFSPTGGTFVTAQSVSLSYTDPNCSNYNIYYTTDDSEPTLSSFKYTSSINLTEGTTTIKAKVFAKNSLNQDINGDTKTESYIISSCLLAPGTSGLGTIDSPKVIFTAKQLNDVRNYLNCHYILGNDIDLNHEILLGQSWYSSVGWTAIGNFTTGGFKGTFNGNNYKIKNLYFAPEEFSTPQGYGLFGYIDSDANITNLILEDVNIIGYNTTGSLAGYNSGKIYNCTSTGTITGRQDVTGGLVGNNLYPSGYIDHSSFNGFVSGKNNVGGLVGINDGGDSIFKAQIKYSFSSGTVSGSQGIGGLVGRNISATITKCFSNSIVSGQNEVGGLIGQDGYYLDGHYYGGGRIEDNYSTGKVNGYANVGGLIGLLNLGSLKRNYSVGFISGDTNVGGLVGTLLGEHVIDPQGTIYYNYWNTQTSGQATSPGGAGVLGKTTSEMYKKQTFVDWDISNSGNTEWRISENNSYPYLRLNSQNPPPQ